MLSCYLKYSAETLSRLGLNPHHCDAVSMPVTVEDKTRARVFAYGNFENIIKVIFADGIPDFSKLVTSHSDPAVRDFVNNFLMKEIPRIPPASTDEEAFAMIIPRSVQTESELRPYLDLLKNYISSARPRPDGDASSTESE